ncbi:MAG TPA: hypothetical protein VGL54_03215 [Solirubrobacteraceae bacterium]|jgi:hypothetical protein
MTGSSRPRSVAGLFGLLAVLLAGAAPAPASAATHDPSGDYAPFAGCPLSNPRTQVCFFAQAEGGELRIGRQAIPIAKTLTIQGGIHEDRASAKQEFIGSEGGETLSTAPQEIPGGRFEIAAPSSLPGYVRAIFDEFIDREATDLTATTEFAAPASAVLLDTQNLVEATGVGLSLPVKIKLGNPLLGGGCYIGSDADPISIPLTTGTTARLLSRSPLTGKPGHAHFKDEYNLVTIDEDSLVNDSFPAPRATGCGGMLAFLAEPAINARLVLPVAAGGNEAILDGTLQTANAPAVKASE